MENSELTSRATFKEKMLAGMKENLILSIIAFLWNKMSNDANICDNPKNFQKEFISLWKKNVSKVTQEQLKTINEVLNDSNADMLNIITGKHDFADIEDYQKIINDSIKESEQIFWKICGKEDNN